MAGEKYDFTIPKVVRGRFTNVRTFESMEFAINPTKIKEKKGANLIEDPLPGQSDPLVRWASGKTSAITIQLELDAEMTYRRFAARHANYASDGEAVPEVWTVDGEIAFIEQFQFPVGDEDGVGGEAFGPDLIAFTFGPRYPGVVCALDDLDIDIEEWTPDLRPTKAKLNIVLKRQVTTNRFSNTIFRIS